MKLGNFNKLFFTITLFFILAGIFAPTTNVGAQYNGGSLNPSTYNPNTPDNRVTTKASGGELTGALDYPFIALLSTGSWAMVSATSTVAGWSGKFFDKMIDTAVVGASANLAPGGSYGQVVESVWQIIRDFGNIMIIFSMLYLAIRTIIQGDGFADRKVLAGILLAAVFINFSLFFTRLVFDVSNTLGTTIYTQITSSGPYANKEIGESIAQLVGVAEVIGQLNEQGFGSPWIWVWQAVGKALFVSMLMIILIFIFFSAGILLFYRMFVFIFLMIFSPIGLISRFIPWLNSAGKKWFDELKKQFLVLPAFFVMLYIALFVAGTILRTEFSGGFKFNLEGVVQYLINFTVLVLFMGATIFVPGMVGSAGSGVMTSAGNKLKGYGRGSIDWAKRRSLKTVGAVAGGGSARILDTTVGRRARTVLNDDKIKAKAAAGDEGAMRKLKRAEYFGKNATYDARNIKLNGKSFGDRTGLGEGIQSYQNRVKENVKKLEEKKKREMELTGLKGKKADTVIREKAKLENESRKGILETAQRSMKQVLDSGDAARIEQAKGVLEKAAEKKVKAQEWVNQAENFGEWEYSQLMKKRADRWYNFARKVNKASTGKVINGAEENWMKGKNKQAMEALSKMLKEDKN